MNALRKLWTLLATDELGERFRRWVCRWYGHHWAHDDRGAPVINLFAVCRRCGKWTRLIDPAGNEGKAS